VAAFQLGVLPAVVVPGEGDGNAAQKDQKRGDYRQIGQRFPVGPDFVSRWATMVPNRVRCGNLYDFGCRKCPERAKFFGFINRLVLSVLSETLMWRLAAGKQLEHTPWP
jgi:hypothetical protein